MKKALTALILVVLIIYISPMHFMHYLETKPVEIAKVDFGDEIPDDYYNQECPIDFLRLGGDPHEWLDGLRWNRPYKPNEWDCSTQAAFLEWALTCCGYEADILVGTSHAWLMVDVGNGPEQYEPTFGAFLGGMEELSTSYWRFESLVDTRAHFIKWWHRFPQAMKLVFDEWFLGEWGWWKIEEGDD